MKHIRYFKESISKDYYSISNSEYNRNLINKSYFTNNEVNYIKDYVDKNISDYKFSKSSDINKIRQIIIIPVTNKEYPVKIFLGKDDDSWYYVYINYYNLYFKCDQIEGLISCLRDKFNELGNFSGWKMKEIEINESVDTEIKELSREELFEFEDKSNFIPFTQSEKNKISECMNKNDQFKVGDNEIIFIRTTLSSKNIYFNIIKYDDDWYIITSSPQVKYYLCDQFDNLLYALENRKKFFKILYE